VFLGRYDHTIDDKGRMTIPARFRELLGGEAEAFISLGFDQNLIVWPAPAFAALTAHLGSLSVADPSARLLRRIFLSNAFQVEFDKAGRILLPQPLRAAAHLENSAIVSGVGETFEIWAPTHWQEQDALIEEARLNSAQFAGLNLPLH
jgi:MraZ protein